MTSTPTATSGADATVRLWDVTTGRTRTTLTGHTGELGSMAFSPDGRTLATTSKHPDRTAVGRKHWQDRRHPHRAHRHRVGSSVQP
ncbi:hypothetical protein [Streptomyces davaonensis]|uniref:hypothetical protein n=1 Tax=Streptomyces davaonensis TaxID=348043 RepID=UPI00034BDF78